MQQKRHESPAVTITWHAGKYKVYNSTRGNVIRDVPAVYILARQVIVTVGDSGFSCFANVSRLSSCN